MSNYIIEESTLTGIADAIREKTSTSDLIKPEDMPDKIKSISGGGGGITSIELPVAISGSQYGSGTYYNNYSQFEVPASRLKKITFNGFLKGIRGSSATTSRTASLSLFIHTSTYTKITDIQTVTYGSSAELSKDVSYVFNNTYESGYICIRVSSSSSAYGAAYFNGTISLEY